MLSVSWLARSQFWNQIMTNARLHSKLVREDLESMGSREVYQFVNQFSPVEIVEVEEEEQEKEKLDKGWVQPPWKKSTWATKDVENAKACDADGDDAKPSGSKEVAVGKEGAAGKEVAVEGPKPKEPKISLKPKTKKMPKTPKPPDTPPPKKVEAASSASGGDGAGNGDTGAMKHIMDKACCFPFVKCFRATIGHCCSSLKFNSELYRITLPISHSLCVIWGPMAR